jgi:dihydroflavonol-4-reductase
MILVTGATGHIGNVLTRQLIECGQKVRVLVLPGEDLEPVLDLPVELVTGDVLDPQSLDRAMAGVDNVFHLAGIISISPGKNERVHKVNVEGTRNVLEAACRAGIRRILYTSSIHAIRPSPLGTAVDETQPFDPDSTRGAYDRSKATATLEALSACARGMDVVVVCPTGVIGPYDYRRSEMGQLIVDCMKNHPLLSVKGAYDFVDVRDVARGMRLAMDKGRTGQAYILSGEQVGVDRLMNTVQEFAGRKTLHLSLPFSLARFAAVFAPLYYRLTRTKALFTPYSLGTLVSNSQISSAKARRELGYTARPVRESIGDAVHWFSEYIPELAPVKVRE